MPAQFSVTSLFQNLCVLLQFRTGPVSLGAQLLRVVAQSLEEASGPSSSPSAGAYHCGGGAVATTPGPLHPLRSEAPSSSRPPKNSISGRTPSDSANFSRASSCRARERHHKGVEPRVHTFHHNVHRSSHPSQCTAPMSGKPTVSTTPHQNSACAKAGCTPFPRPAKPARPPSVP